MKDFQEILRTHYKFFAVTSLQGGNIAETAELKSRSVIGVTLTIICSNKFTRW